MEAGAEGPGLSCQDGTISVSPSSGMRSCFGEILFVSASVHEYQQLLDGISSNVEVHVLDPARDGVAQMAEILAGRTGIDAIHLIGDGTEAEMHLGASFLTQDSISTRYAEQFQQIGRSLSANADLLIYEIQPVGSAASRPADRSSRRSR